MDIYIKGQPMGSMIPVTPLLQPQASCLPASLAGRGAVTYRITDVPEGLTAQQVALKLGQTVVTEMTALGIYTYPYHALGWGVLLKPSLDDCIAKIMAAGNMRKTPAAESLADKLEIDRATIFRRLKQDKPPKHAELLCIQEYIISLYKTRPRK